MSTPTPRDIGWHTPADVHAPAAAAGPPRVQVVARDAERSSPWSRLAIGVASARGEGRPLNEDAHSAPDGEGALFVVADGVGGGAMAARASRELVVRLHSKLADGDADEAKVRHALLDADRAIERDLATVTDATGAATVVLCQGLDRARSRWLVAWVGDCRAYRVDHGGSVELVTVDDTYRNLDEVPPPGGSLDDPARMVGNGAVDRPNVRIAELAGGDMLVLCSDGIHKHVTDADLASLGRGPAPLARRCLALIESARRGGSRDDATVLVVQRATREGRSRRFAGLLLIVLVAGATMWWAMRAGAAVAGLPAVVAAHGGGIR